MLSLLVISLTLCAYTWLVYPLLIYVLARVRPLPVEGVPSWTPSVTVCMAVHNGAVYIERKLRSLLEQNYPPGRLDVMVYVDGCTDETLEVVRAFAQREPRLRVLSGEVRSGKPSAINRMRREAAGEVLLMTDVRQPLAPDCLRRLVAMLGARHVGCVSGTLVLSGTTGAGLYWWYENHIRRSESRFRSMLGATGTIYVIRRNDLDEIPRDTILDDMWIPMRLRLRGLRLLFCPDAAAYDTAFEDTREFSRKVRTLAGNYQLFGRMPELLLPHRNPSWFETVSHKVLRLLSPWALSLLVVSTIAVRSSASPAPRPLAWLLSALAASEIGFAGLALLGPRAGRGGVAARSFVVLNAAAIIGLWRYISGTQRVTW